MSAVRLERRASLVACGDAERLTTQGCARRAASEPRQDRRDRPGRRPQRLRLPAAARRRRARRGEHVDPWRPGAAHAGGPRPDLRQVRSAPVHPARRRPAGHPRGASKAPGRGTSDPVHGRADGDPRGARPRPRARLRRVLARADRLGLDRPGAHRAARRRQRGRGQGPAPRRGAPAQRGRPAPLPDRQDRQGAGPAPPVHRRGRDRGRAGPHRPAGARLRGRGQHDRGLPGQLRGLAQRRRPPGVLAVHDRTGADDGASRRHAAQPRGLRRVVAGRPHDPRQPHRRDVDADDLRARDLPRRSASGEPARGRSRPSRARRLRHGRAAQPARPRERRPAAHGHHQRRFGAPSASVARPRRAVSAPARGGARRAAQRDHPALLGLRPRRHRRARGAARDLPDHLPAGRHPPADGG